MRLQEAYLGTGDLLFFEEKRVPSRVVQAYQWAMGYANWRLDHVAFLVRRSTEGWQEFWVCQALPGPGVVTRRLEALLADCAQRGVKVHWFKLTHEANVLNRTELARTIDAELDKPYASWWQFAWSFTWPGRWLSRLLGARVPADLDPYRDFCSEYGMKVFREEGILSDLEPALTCPAELSTLWFLDDMGELTI